MVAWFVDGFIIFVAIVTGVFFEALIVLLGGLVRFIAGLTVIGGASVAAPRHLCLWVGGSPLGPDRNRKWGSI